MTLSFTISRLSVFQTVGWWTQPSPFIIKAWHSPLYWGRCGLCLLCCLYNTFSTHKPSSQSTRFLLLLENKYNEGGAKPSSHALWHHLLMAYKDALVLAALCRRARPPSDIYRLTRGDGGTLCTSGCSWGASTCFHVNVLKRGNNKVFHLYVKEMKMSSVQSLGSHYRGVCEQAEFFVYPSLMGEIW